MRDSEKEEMGLDDWVTNHHSNYQPGPVPSGEEDQQSHLVAEGRAGWHWTGDIGNTTSNL